MNVKLCWSPVYGSRVKRNYNAVQHAVKGFHHRRKYDGYPFSIGNVFDFRQYNRGNHKQGRAIIEDRRRRFS